MPGAHEIGAAISGPRIAGGNFMDITFFFLNKHQVDSKKALLRNVPVTPTPVFFQKYCRTNGRGTAVQMGGVLQGFPFFEA